MNWPLAMLIALTLDALIGWPPVLFSRIGHPVTWLGALINALDRRFNSKGSSASARRRAGLTASVVVIGIAAGSAAVLVMLLPEGALGAIIAGVLAWPLVAARSLHTHVAAVAEPLAAGDLGAAQTAVGMIVGRDPAQLDNAGVARAALESLAENTSDGVVAPLFWGALLGLPGIAAYKAINTLDSMIGHRTERHRDFGRAAARIDDAANLIPARLTALFFALTSGRPRAALNCAASDARHHRSPNAGWPEAAIAGALARRLSGPRVYENHIADEPWINGNAADPAAGDLFRGLKLYIRGLVAMAGLLALWAWI